MRTLLLTTITVIAACWTTVSTAQITNNRSEAVENQIRINANTGAHEYNGISVQYSFTFSDVISQDEAHAIDGKLQTLFPEIRSVSTSPSSNYTKMIVEVDPMLNYDEVKGMVSRFGYNLTESHKEYIVTK